MKRPALLALVLLATAPRFALAQPAAPDPVFDEARTLLQAGKFAEACTKFQTTWETKATPGKAFNLSVCEEKQDHLVRAARWMTEGLAMLAPTDDRRPGAVERREGLEKRTPRLTVVLVDPSLATTEVTIDGTRIDLGVRTPIDIGKHRIVAKLAGHDDGLVELTLVEAEVKQVSVQAGPVTNAAAPLTGPIQPQPLAPVAPAPSGGGEGQRIAGISLMAVGGASLVGFGVMAGLVSAKHSAFKSSKDPKEQNDLANAGKKLEIGEGVLLGLGIVAAGVGITVFATAPKSSPKATTGLTIAPTFSFTDKSGSGGFVGSF